MTRAKKWRIAGLSLLVAGIAIQPFRPERNRSAGPFPRDIVAVVPVPDSIHTLLRAACYDCHSNNTTYPWYAEIQPGGWYLAHHISEGKAELNFHEFAAYSKRRQEGKLKAIAGQVKDGEMPLPSYTWLHPEARLSKAQKARIIAWARAAADSLAEGE